jgi:ABC-type branched-subunit amino acid transport system ATPase component
MADRTLEIENLSVFYGSAQAVDGFSMSLDRGEMLALIGGKSTLLGAGPVPARRGCKRVGQKHRVADTGATTIASRISIEAQNGF